MKIAVVAAMALASIVMAQDKPTDQSKSVTIDLTQTLKDLEGKPLADVSDAGGKPIPVQLGETLWKALEWPMQMDSKDPAAAGLAKFKRDAIAMRIYSHKSVTLTTDEVQIVKECVGVYASTRAVGVIWRLLDPKLAAEASK